MAISSDSSSPSMTVPVATSSTAPSMPIQLFNHPVNPAHTTLIPNIHTLKKELEAIDDVKKRDILSQPEVVASQMCLGQILTDDSPCSRPLFITALKVFVVFDDKKAGDLRVANGMFKNVYLTYCLTDGEIYTYYSIKEDDATVLNEFRIGATTRCGPRIEGIARRTTKKFLGHGKTKGSVIVERFDGDLAKFIGSGQIDLRNTDVALGILRQMSETLGEFNEKGMIHRDVKFPNFLVRQLEEGVFTIKITDFGLAIPKKNGMNIRMRGNPLAMPPEVALQLREMRFDRNVFVTCLTEKIDGWGLATSILSYMMTFDIPVGLKARGILFDQFKNYYLDDKSTAPVTQHDLEKLLISLRRVSGDWIEKPDEKDTLAFVLWNLLKIHPRERWSPQIAFRYLSMRAAQSVPSSSVASTSES